MKAAMATVATPAVPVQLAALPGPAARSPTGVLLNRRPPVVVKSSR
jgi:hypothetical protein